MAPEPTLAYWPIRGLANSIRFLLEFTGTKYNEKFYTSREEWLAAKPNLGLDVPNLPYFFDGDIKLSESNAIMRYIARKNGLAGTCEKDYIRIDIAYGVIMDVARVNVALCYNENFETAKVAYINDIATPVGKLSALLGNRNFICGDKISYADFLMYEVMERLLLFVPTGLDSNLQNYHKRISELPAMKKYIASDAFQKIKTQFNGNTAKFAAGKF